MERQAAEANPCWVEEASTADRALPEDHCSEARCFPHWEAEARLADQATAAAAAMAVLRSRVRSEAAVNQAEVRLHSLAVEASTAHRAQAAARPVARLADRLEAEEVLERAVRAKVNDEACGCEQEAETERTGE